MHFKAGIKKNLAILGGISAVIGIIDLPDQVQRWSKFLLSALGFVVNWDADILGNQGRWVFSILGIALLLTAYDAPQKLFTKIFRRKESEQLKIHFENGFVDPYFKTSLEQTPEGNGTYALWLYRLKVENLTDCNVEDVRIEIERFVGLPDRHGADDRIVREPHWKLRFEGNDGTSMTFTPHHVETVRFLSMKDGRPFDKTFIWIEGNGQQILHQWRRYEVTVKLTARELRQPIRKDFIASVDLNGYFNVTAV